MKTKSPCRFLSVRTFYGLGVESDDAELLFIFTDERIFILVGHYGFVDVGGIDSLLQHMDASACDTSGACQLCDKRDRSIPLHFSQDQCGILAEPQKSGILADAALLVKKEVGFADAQQDVEQHTADTGHGNLSRFQQITELLQEMSELR